MRFFPPSAFLFPHLAAFLAVVLSTPWAQGQNPAAAVSSQAVATQPPIPSPGRLAVPKSPSEKATTQPIPGPKARVLDPLLDFNRPKGCQLGILKDQTIRSKGVEVFLPAGIYQQVKVVEGPQKRTAADSADLRSQAQGLGYIRYLADGKIKVDGEERSGGIDVGVRSSDQLPLRIWYKKFNPPDDTTKALGFIFPPIMIAAGAGAWSSGNVLIPDANPEFTENRNYYLKENKTHTSPGSADNNLYQIKPAHAAQGGTFYSPGTPPSALRTR